MSRTVMVPDYGASGSWWQPVQVPEPGEAGYMTPAERVAAADPGDPWPLVIAKEQAYAESLAEPEAG